MTRLAQIAHVVRSKNTSPFTWSLDIIFRERADYERFRDQNLIDEALIARLYGLELSKVLDVICFEPAAAIKVCLLRDVSSGAPGDRDVYGAQQHGPLLDWDIPEP
jgi:hypothetical protein